MRLVISSGTVVSLAMLSYAAVSAAPGVKDLAAIPQVAKRAVESVVNISSTRIVRSPYQPFFQDPFFRFFFGPGGPSGVPRERRERSLGSGVVVGNEGVVITNNHVVEGADRIVVTLANGDDYEAELLGRDPKTDVAVLRLQEPPKGLAPLEFGDSGTLKLGEVVLAIGNPFGLSHTVTMGIVSAKGRANVGIVDYEDFIQTDAAINPGNSGGALVDLNGKLIGINTAIASRSGGYQGIGFAIPSNMAKAVMESLLKYGKVIRGWLGVSIQALDRKLVKALNLPSRTRGVLVTDVVPSSPAEKAGLKRGDVIMEIEHERVDSVGRLRNLIASLGAGNKVRMKVLRNGKVRKVEALLAELDEGGNAAETRGREFGKAELGLKVGPLTRAARRRFKLPDRLKHGAVILDVAPSSPAAASGLMPGDVVLEVNQDRVVSAKDMRRKLTRAGNEVLLLVYRRGRTFYVVLRR